MSLITLSQSIDPKQKSHAISDQKKQSVQNHMKTKTAHRSHIYMRAVIH